MLDVKDNRLTHEYVQSVYLVENTYNHLIKGTHPDQLYTMPKWFRDIYSKTPHKKRSIFVVSEGSEKKLKIKDDEKEYTLNMFDFILKGIFKPVRRRKE